MVFMRIVTSVRTNERILNMSNNITTNSIEFYKFIIAQWKWFHGLLTVIALEIALLYCISINHEEVIIIKAGLAAAMSVITFFVWVISTNRWFHRTQYWVLVWITIMLICSGLFAYFVYPTYIENSKYGGEFVRWCGASITGVLTFLMYYLIDFKIWKRKSLYIVFLVSDSSKNEEKILSTLNAARREIEEASNDIKIIIPPFGIAESIKECERFINGWFCQADAVIYTKMLESDDEFGYKFKDFTSRMNSHRLPRTKEDGIDVNLVLSEASKCSDWNTLNIKRDSISKKEFLAKNLSHLLLIYVGCIYMYKRQYSDAIPVANRLFEQRTDNAALNAITRDVIAEAYLTAEQWEEQEKKDYEKALNTLVECKRRLPYIALFLRYKLSMARVCMLMGDIKESKKHTRSVTPPTRYDVHGPSIDSKAYDWYIDINLAFYAIYERKPKEIISNYKKLFKAPAPDNTEVHFAIRFQLNELEKTADNQYRMMLYHGLAFLNLYLSHKDSMKYLRKAEHLRNENGYQQLDELRDIISKNNRKLSLRK